MGVGVGVRLCVCLRASVGVNGKPCVVADLVVTGACAHVCVCECVCVCAGC